MNRLTAIGLASLVAYGLLITSKYMGVVSAAHDDPGARSALGHQRIGEAITFAPAAEPRQATLEFPAPLPRTERMRSTPAAIEFRAARDLKAYADALTARRASLTGDERYHLAKALEECQFTTTINEDLAAYSAKQRRQFLASLPAGDPLNTKRVAAYEAVDNTQRCLRFQGAKVSAKEIEDLFLQAAQQGDARAQARLLVAELNKNLNTNTRGDSQSARVAGDDFARIVTLLESRDPEAMMIVGQFLAQSAMASQLRVGPNGEVPEPSAFLGAFSLVACDLERDCQALSREPQLACAYGSYCDTSTFEQLYQNFLASPWTYMQAVRYRNLIHSAVDTGNWALIGLTPQTASSQSQSTGH
jgi:hypothetical protein